MSSNRGIRRSIVVAGVMAVTMSLFAAPANAAPGAGTIAFTCTASYPNFPGSGSGATCSGTGTGTVASASGNGVFPATAFAMTFTYSAGTPTCPLGLRVSGTFNLGGAVTGNFTTPAAGAVGTGAVPLDVYGVNGAGLTNASGQGLWIQESPNSLSNCPAGGGPLTATVVGELTFTDTN